MNFETLTDFAKEYGLFGIIAVLVYAIIRHLRGRTGHGDLAFMILRLYPPLTEGGSMRLEACTIHVSTMKDVVENILLRMRILWGFFWAKNGVLLIEDETMRRRIMSEFRHVYSAVINADNAADWARREDGESGIVKFIFCLSDRWSKNQRKFRAIALTRAALDVLEREGVDALEIPEAIEFIRDILRVMVKNSLSYAGVNQVLPRL